MVWLLDTGQEDYADLFRMYGRHNSLHRGEVCGAIVRALKVL